jgi:hypothetical protein
LIFHRKLLASRAEERDPAKACPGLDLGWKPVRRKIARQTIESRRAKVFAAKKFV